MPAYYYTQLYKDSSELDIEGIVNGAVDSLIEAGCTYQHARITAIADDSLPQEQQVPLFEDKLLRKDEAVRYAIQDIETWISHGNKWLSGINLIFTYNFLFDQEVLADLKAEKLEEARQVSLSFWAEEDIILKKNTIRIDIDTWEEYVLMYGASETHKYNKQQILKMMECVCREIHPYFGWLDGECNSYGASYLLLEEGKLPIANEYVVIGPQVFDRIPMDDIERSPHFVKRLNNGIIVLRDSNRLGI